MSEKNVELSGRCLCGAVRFECSEAPSLAAHCACEDCRKSSGTSHCTHVPVSADSVTLRGATATYSHPADSGNIVTRHFCGTCGNAIYSTNNAMPSMKFLRASSLDDLNAINPTMFVYASRAPKWAGIGEGLTTFDEMPPAPTEEIIENARQG